VTALSTEQEEAATLATQATSGPSSGDVAETAGAGRLSGARAKVPELSGHGRCAYVRSRVWME